MGVSVVGWGSVVKGVSLNGFCGVEIWERVGDARDWDWVC
jgi:hypothetical protein